MSIAFQDLELLGEIGRGMFGKVFKAEYLGTEVAVKECFQEADMEKYFDREVAILKEARHPNVVQFIDMCVHEKFYIVTEYVPGGNLKEWIGDESKPLTLQLCINFATDVARALFFLHTREIIHRDIKGENLLLTDNGRVKVCDFGFSRLAAKDMDEMRRMSYCGTDGYMAPEIMLGMEFGTSVDIFSFGVVIAELLTRTMAEDGVIEREIPGFGLKEESITENIYHTTSCSSLADLLRLCMACTQVQEKERPSWKETLQELRVAEMSLPELEHAGTYNGDAPFADIESESLDEVSLESVSDVSNHRPHILSLFEAPPSDGPAVATGRETEWSGEGMARERGGDQTVRRAPRPVVEANASSIKKSPPDELSSFATESLNDPNDEAGDMDQASGSTSIDAPKVDMDKTLKVSIISASVQNELADIADQPSAHHFSVVKAPTISKCGVCQRRFGVLPGFTKYMVCDDCGFNCHRKCASSAQLTCGYPTKEDTTVGDDQEYATIRG